MVHLEKPPEHDDDDASRRTWDTAYVKPRDRFSYFREAVSQAFLSFSPERPAHGKVSCRVTQFMLPEECISTNAGIPINAKRNKSDLSKINDAFFSLTLQNSNSILLEIDDISFKHTQGELALINSNKIKSVSFYGDNRYDVISLIFPRSLMADVVHAPDFLIMDQPNDHLLKQCARMLNERYLTASKPELSSLFGSVICLLNAGLIRDQEYLEHQSVQQPSIQSGILQAIKYFIRAEIANPTLSTTSVATHFGITPRYIQKLFSAEHTTFKTYMLEARLHKIRSDLTNPTLADALIGDIALRWGFKEMTTFNRNFKKRFGDTPDQIRLVLKR